MEINLTEDQKIQYIRSRIDSTKIIHTLKYIDSYMPTAGHHIDVVYLFIDEKKQYWFKRTTADMNSEYRVEFNDAKWEYIDEQLIKLIFKHENSIS